MNRLAAWLTACVDEDERAARIISAGGFAPQRWETDPPGQVNPDDHPASRAISEALRLDEEERPCGWVAIYAWERLNDEPPERDSRQWDVPVALIDSGRRQFDHIARYDPRRALAEAEFKRDAIAGYVDQCEWEEGVKSGTIGADIEGIERHEHELGCAYRVVLALAEIYSDKPGYAEAIAEASAS